VNWSGPQIPRRRRGRCLRTCAVAWRRPGASFDDVVKLTFFVRDVADLPAVRTARDAVIDTARPPASTAVQVAALFAPGYLLEAEAWALVGD
jgi:enamine deaminase RidA (YjgF/YER057c/UK114 family)